MKNLKILFFTLVFVIGFSSCAVQPSRNVVVVKKHRPARVVVVRPHYRRNVIVVRR